MDIIILMELNSNIIKSPSKMGKGDVLNVLEDAKKWLSSHEISKMTGVGSGSVTRCLRGLLYKDKAIMKKEQIIKEVLEENKVGYNFVDEYKLRIRKALQKQEDENLKEVTELECAKCSKSLVNIKGKAIVENENIYCEGCSDLLNEALTKAKILKIIDEELLHQLDVECDCVSCENLKELKQKIKQ